MQGPPAERECDLDRVGQQAAQERQQLAAESVEVHRHDGERLLAREGEQSLDQVAGPFGGAFDVVEGAAECGVAPRALARRAGGEPHGLQQVAEVVGDAGRHAAE